MMHSARSTIAFSLALLAGLTLAAESSAQSAEQQVEQAVTSFYQNLAAGNASAWASLVAAEGSGNFARTGFVLSPNNRPETTGMQASFDSGQLSYQLTVHHLDVTAYGDDTAVATFYTTGPSVVNGTDILGTFRVSQVWVRQGQSWQAVHWHISPLEG